jgi:hypothetical protein
MGPIDGAERAMQTMTFMAGKYDPLNKVEFFDLDLPSLNLILSRLLIIYKQIHYLINLSSR